jgi:hypothetical protein
MNTATVQDDARLTQRCRYKAFISHGHATDRPFARILQSALQNFGKPFYRRRAFQVFRDETDLTTTPSLWDSIQEALDSSEFFILLASPPAAKSQWVPREINRWLDVSGGQPSRLFIILTDGDIKWDDEACDFDWARTSALPDALKGQFNEESLYLDFRWAHEMSIMSLRNPRFLDAIATLAAPLHGKPKTDMIGQDLKNHRRFKAFVASAFVFLCVALAATGAAFYVNQLRLQAEIDRLNTQNSDNFHAFRIHELEQRLKEAGLDTG